MKIPIKGSPNLVKDPVSKAVLNTNKQDIIVYKARKAEQERLNRLEALVEELKIDLEELRCMTDKYYKKPGQGS